MKDIETKNNYLRDQIAKAHARASKLKSMQDEAKYLGQTTIIQSSRQSQVRSLLAWPQIVEWVNKYSVTS